jgi:hypothetical protein
MIQLPINRVHAPIMILRSDRSSILRWSISADIKFSTVCLTARQDVGRRTSLEGTDMAVLKKGARITGAERHKLAESLRKQYDRGRSIRELAESNGRSYGFVHRVLSESGTTLRGRGGATRSKQKAKMR